MTLSPQGQAALSYAARGWPVLPLHAPTAGVCSCGKAALCTNIGKHPRTAHGCLDASTDAALIEKWWSDWPDANVGLRTGVWGDVLDLDTAEAVKEFESIVAGHGGDAALWPHVFTSKGAHYYLAPTGVPKNRVALADKPGWDFRSENGYVVAPPSVHASGFTYIWGVAVNGTLPVAPDELLALLRSKAHSNVHKLTVGTRNNTLTSMAGAMRRRDMSTAAIEAALQAENGRSESPLEASEVRQIVESAAKMPAADDDAVPQASDHLNAARFLQANGDSVRYCSELDSWFLWNGAWWERDLSERVRELARQTVDSLREWAAEAPDLDSFKKRTSHYIASARSGRDEGLLKLARVQPSVSVLVSQLDQHPYSIACLNGTVDVRTLELREADPADLITHGVRLAYLPLAQSELFKDFLATTFGADDDLIGYVARVLGYASTGVVAEHVVVVMHGPGGNGKSTLIGMVQDILGEMAMTAPDGLFAQSRHDYHPERIAVLRGKRLVVTYELESRATLAETTIKTLTGGDTLTAREMYGDRFDFKPSHTVIIVANHRPRVHGTDEAIWRRLRLVPFDHTVKVEDRDDHLRQTLVEKHGAAILRWLIEGAFDWHLNGLGIARKVEAATLAYRHEQDTLADFLEERTEKHDTLKAKIGDLFTAWQEWTEAAGERPGRRQDFVVALEDHGIETESYQGQRYAKHRVVKP